MAIVKRIYKTQISFLARVRDQGGKFYPSKNFDTEAEAKDHERELIRRKSRGEKNISKDARITTLNEFWDVWSLDSVRRASEGWRLSQDQMFRDYVSPVIGGLTLSEIDSPAVGRVIGNMERLGRAGNTIKHVYSLLHKLFGDAVEYYEMLPSNPVKSKFHRPEVFVRERKYLSPEDTRKLLESSRGSWIGPAIWLGSVTALRISEIQGLTEDCLFYREGYILVKRIFNKKLRVIQDFPKQGDWARVPMPAELAEYLGSLKLAPGAFVVQGPRGGMLAYETFTVALRRACLAAGVTKITPHELRHSATELWISHGASEEDIRRLLNHKSLGATKRYIHRTETRLNDLGSKIHLKLIVGGESVHSDVHESVHSRQQSDVCKLKDGLNVVKNSR